MLKGPLPPGCVRTFFICNLIILLFLVYFFFIDRLTECSLRHAGPQLHGQGRLHQDEKKMFVAYGMFVHILDLFYSSVVARETMGTKSSIYARLKSTNNARMTKYRRTEILWLNKLRLNRAIQPAQVSRAYYVFVIWG